MVHLIERGGGYLKIHARKPVNDMIFAVNKGVFIAEDNVGAFSVFVYKDALDRGKSRFYKLG